MVQLPLLFALLDEGLLFFARQILPAFGGDLGELGDAVIWVQFGNAGLLLFEEMEEAGGGSFGFVAHCLCLFLALLVGGAILTFFPNSLRLLLLLLLFRLLRTLLLGLVYR